MRGLITMLLAAAVLMTGMAGAETYLSPHRMVTGPDGMVYVTLSTARQVVAWDPAAQSIQRNYALPNDPNGIALSPDGAHLYVAAGGANGLVYVIDGADGSILGQYAVGHTPVSPVVSPDGARLYVPYRFNDAVAVLSTEDGALLDEIAVVREPIAAALTPDGATLAVANHLPDGRADGAYIAAAISLIDTAAGDVSARIDLPNGSSSLRDLAVSPCGGYAVASHILSRYHLPTTQLERGWMNTNAFSIIDIQAGALLNTVLLDDVDLGAANPWAVAFGPDGERLLVSHAGSHEVSVIDWPALLERLTSLDENEAANVPNRLSFLLGMRQRVRLDGLGPRGILVHGDQAIVAEYFSDSIGVVELAGNPYSVASLPLGEPKEVNVVRQGEIFFNDAALCFQQWQSCESCHPDARVDGLNWDLLNDGIGNPKNTRSMLLTHATPPVMSLGVRADAETAVRAGIRFIQFAVRPEEDAVAIDEYLKALEPVPSPYLVDGELSPAAERGRELFIQAGCADCHPAPLYTDKKLHDVGTGTGMDEGKPFNTPTLIESWRTAPYMHDGRSETMIDVLTVDNPDDRHGKTSNLTEEQIRDLAEYVLTR